MSCQKPPAPRPRHLVPLWGNPTGHGDGGHGFLGTSTPTGVSPESENTNNRMHSTTSNGISKCVVLHPHDDDELRVLATPTALEWDLNALSTANATSTRLCAESHSPGYKASTLLVSSNFCCGGFGGSLYGGWLRTCGFGPRGRCGVGGLLDLPRCPTCPYRAATSTPSFLRKSAQSQ